MLLTLFTLTKKASFARCHLEAGTSIKNINGFLLCQMEKEVRKAENQ